uniref:Amidohydro-rel domain-containing protein n=1 Tax=Heterorhabditis bacteriophora TaxID=37862 RepID=A0A1I7XSZ5_HETBA
MNGMRTVCQLYRWMQTENLVEKAQRIRGIVFDSCPCHMSPWIHSYGMAVTRPGIEWMSDSIRVMKFIPYTCMRYLTSDAIVEYKSVEKFIAYQKSKGCNVTIGHIGAFNALPNYDKVLDLSRKELLEDGILGEDFDIE